MATIVIADDTYARLLQEADRLGISIGQLIDPVLKQIARESSATQVDPLDWSSAMALWRQEAGKRSGRYSDSHVLDDSREGIYEDRLRSQM